MNWTEIKHFFDVLGIFIFFGLAISLFLWHIWDEWRRNNPRLYILGISTHKYNHMSGKMKVKLRNFRDVEYLLDEDFVWRILPSRRKVSKSVARDLNRLIEV